MARYILDMDGNQYDLEGAQKWEGAVADLYLCRDGRYVMQVGETYGAPTSMQVVGFFVKNGYGFAF